MPRLPFTLKFSGLKVLLLVAALWQALVLSAVATTAIPTLSWSSTAAPYAARTGQDITLYCPGPGTPAPTWGSDTYSTSSSVCTAAVHAGLITFEEGGAIAIRILPEETVVGSDRNDIATGSLSDTAATFTFTNPRDFVADILPTPYGDLPLHPIPWTATAAPDWRQPAPIEAYYCPVGEPQPVWGSGPYSQASSLCTAAVHAGQITLAGGPIVVERLPGQGYYSGSAANGVEARSRVGDAGSFRLLSP